MIYFLEFNPMNLRKSSELNKNNSNEKEKKS